MKVTFDPKRLIQTRRDNYWTQEDLATASGVSSRTIQRIERNGGGSLETWKALAAAFDIDVLTFEVDRGTRFSERFDARFKYMGMGMAFTACLVGCFFSWLPILIGSSRKDGLTEFWVSLFVAVAMSIYSIVLLTWSWRRLNRMS